MKAHEHDEEYRQKLKKCLLVENVCLLTAFVMILFSVLYLFDSSRYIWMLRSVILLSVFLNFGLMFLSAFAERWAFAGGALILAILSGGSFLYLTFFA